LVGLQRSGEDALVATRILLVGGALWLPGPASLFPIATVQPRRAVVLVVVVVVPVGVLFDPCVVALALVLLFAPSGASSCLGSPLHSKYKVNTS